MSEPLNGLKRVYVGGVGRARPREKKEEENPLPRAPEAPERDLPEEAKAPHWGTAEAMQDPSSSPSMKALAGLYIDRAKGMRKRP